MRNTSRFSQSPHVLPSTSCRPVASLTPNLLLLLHPPAPTITPHHFILTLCSHPHPSPPHPHPLLPSSPLTTSSSPSAPTLTPHYLILTLPQQEPEDISYVYSGYAPLSVRLVEMLSRSHGVLENAEVCMNTQLHTNAHTHTHMHAHMQAYTIAPLSSCLCAPALEVASWANS